MERDSLDRFEKLFREALARAPDERAAFLDTHCRDDPELRQELESLLRADAKANADGFLDPPIWRLPSYDDDRTATFAAPPHRAPSRPDDLPSVAAVERPHPGGARLSVDQYDILEELGRGGMGVVYKARDVRLRRTVALKFLPPSRHTQARAQRRFVQEARLASALDHPNICTIHEIGETETGPLYIAMAYYEGETLKEKIAGGPLPLNEALDYARQIADGLQRAHDTGIVHRDVKPANVIVTDDGLVKLLDFGVAKMADRSRTRTGAVLGTLGYVSPEQVQGTPVDERTDLWALGVVLYEMLTGQRPFSGDTDSATVYAIVHEDPEPATALRPDLPSSLDAFFARALDKDPEQRFQSAREMGRALKQLRVPQADASPVPADRSARTVAGRAKTDALVGRDGDLRFLHRQLNRALNGERRIVFVSGEAGLGKTALVDAFLQQATDGTDLLVGRGQCIEHRGEGEPYLPVLDSLSRLCKGPHRAPLLSLLRRCAPTWMIQMPWLLEDDDVDSLERRAMGATRERMLREFVEVLDRITEIAPLILAFEDLHWSDDSTAQLINGLARRPEPARLLVLGTCRPADPNTKEHSFSTLKQELCRHDSCTELALELLSEADAATFLARHLGGDPPVGLRRLFYQRTDGNPLFMHTLLDYWTAQGALVKDAGTGTTEGGLDQLARGLPDTLRSMIEQQFQQLAPKDQRLLEAASVVGRTFSATAVAAALDADEAVIERRCVECARSGLFLGVEGITEWDDGRVSTQFHFLHNLYQEVLYDRVPAGYRMWLHRNIGNQLELAYGERARENAAELALHFARGREPERAVPYLQEAAQRALQRSAHNEAIQHLTSAIELLRSLPETPDRAQRKITLHTLLGTTYTLTEGWGSARAERAYERAYTLSRDQGTPADLAHVLYSMAAMYELRGEYHTSQALLEERLSLPQASDDAEVVGAHELLACSLFHQGAFERALDHAERGLRSYDPERQYALLATFGDDPGVSCHDWAALSLWFLGRPDQALERALEAVRLAETHGYSLATAQMRTAWIYQCRRQVGPTQRWAERSIALATEQGFPYQQAVGAILKGWALALQDSVEEGIDLLRRGMADCRAAGADMDRPYFAALLAEAYGRNERVDDGLAILDEALEHVRGDRSYFYEPELYRLKGTLLRQRRTQGDRVAAEAALLQAHKRARDMETPPLELRAATGLVRLWRRSTRYADGLDLVEAAYRRFTDGFDTPDLVEAQALLSSNER